MSQFSNPRHDSLVIKAPVTAMHGYREDHQPERNEWQAWMLARAIMRPHGVAVAVAIALSFSGCTERNRLSIKAGAGNPKAMYEYGLDLWKHTNGRKDEVDEALMWMTKAAEKGEPDAMYQIASIASAGGAVDPSGLGKYWFRKGAEAGNRFCMIKLAEGYRYGRLGLPIDQSEANRWYDAATRAKKPGDM